MRQLGLAVLTFESTLGVFPASGWTQRGPGNPNGKFIGWRPMILPFIEQQHLSTRYDPATNWWEGANVDAAAVPIQVFRCPSVPTRAVVTSATAHPPRPSMNFHKPLAPTDYEAIMGIRPSSINSHLASPRYTHRNRFSVMHRNSRTRTKDIRDGTTRTIVMVECGGRPQVFRNGHLRKDLANDQGIGWADSEGPFSLDGSSADGDFEGLGPAAGCIFGMNRKNDNEPYSFHPGGGHSLFADGHIKFLSEEISLITLAALCTRNGRESPALDQP